MQLIVQKKGKRESFTNTSLNFKLEDFLATQTKNSLRGPKLLSVYYSVKKLRAETRKAVSF